MKNIVVFDIDGTLADIDHRQIHVKEEPKDWPAFWKGMEKDIPHKPVIELCNTMYNAGKTIYLCTGRLEKYREITEEWMQKNGVFYHVLLMTKDDDFRGDIYSKIEMLEFIGKDNILFVVDDRKRCVDMWRDHDVLCLQPQDGDF